MMTKNFFRIDNFIFFSLILSIAVLSSCDKDPETPLLKTSFNYQMHQGQIEPTAPYSGVHEVDLTATLELEEQRAGGTLIRVTVNNTINGETYNIHAHDAADPNSTPNGTPYIESPNVTIFAKAITGTGASVSVEQETAMSFKELTEEYNGFFVIHDPLQSINTADLTTFLVVSTFAREQSAVSYKSNQFNYAFNTGQLVADFAYAGSHSNNLSAQISLYELADNTTRVVVKIENTMADQTYHTHAHDAADPATTPNGTPYIESPNGKVFASAIKGNAGTASAAVISNKSVDELANNYEGFFVIHDPLQDVSTTDPTTFVILGSFAR